MLDQWRPPFVARDTFVAARFDADDLGYPIDGHVEPQLTTMDDRWNLKSVLEATSDNEA